MISEVTARPVVLSADDDEDAHILLKRAFSKSETKAALFSAHDGVEAIQYISGEGKFANRETYPAPHLLLLDLKMPKRSGFEVLEHLRQNPPSQKFPVIVFTSSDNENDVRRAQSLGCHAYVVKPTDFDKLVRFVKSIEAEFFGNPKSDSPSASGFASFTIPLKNMAPAKASEPANLRPIVPETPDLYRSLVEQVKDYAIFMLDKEGKILSWNEGARRIKGYEPSEIIGKHFSIFYPAHDKENEKPQFELRMSQEMGRYEEEGWRLRKDGSRFWANVVITPLRENNGKLTGYAQVTRDLTQKKFQEDHLQRLLDSEERFRLLVEQVKDYAIFMLDAKGNIASWNQGARRLKGYSSDEAIGKHFSMFYTPEDLAKDHPAKELSMAIRDGRYEEEGWRIKKDGSRFWANVVITALWDKRGNLSGFAKVTRDLTQRKREEIALRQKNEELEAFAHSLSHDIRAPLRSLSSFAQILKSDASQLSEKEREDYLEKIIKSVRSMEALTNDILKFSQVSLTTASMETLPLEEIINESLAMLEAEIKESKAAIKIDEPLPNLTANRTLLVQVFSNLLANALKFVAPGTKPKIHIYVTRKNGDCEIHVKDSGLGIPEEFQQSIFRIFERGNVEGNISGSGVGLAIVKKAMERLGGTVTVRSKAGEGSDFVVTLPCSFSEPVLTPA